MNVLTLLVFKRSPLISFSKPSLFFWFVYLSINLFIAVAATRRKLVLSGEYGLTNQFSYVYVLVFLSIYAPRCVLSECVQQLLYESQSLLRKCIHESVCYCSTPLDSWSQPTPVKQRENQMFEMKKKKEGICSDMCSKLPAQAAVDIWSLLIKQSIHFQRWWSD